MTAMVDSIALNSRRRWARTIVAMVRGIGQVLLSPLTLFLGIRRSLTAASATLLIVVIATLNIIWGYPWIGMFSACLSLMVVGWLMNRALKPRLAISVSLPASAAAGEAFTVRQHVENRGRLPALEMQIHIEGDPAQTASLRHVTILSPPANVRSIRPRGRAELNARMRYDRRGIHSIPDSIVETGFPFFLFRLVGRVPTQTQIAITPRLLDSHDDPATEQLLSEASGWMRRQLTGESMDYVGSREYQVGMPVRRWDFASWARLGRPIVREFTTPSARTVTLLVDMGQVRPANRRERIAMRRDFERLVSLAATMIVKFDRLGIRPELLLSSASDDSGTGPAAGRESLASSSSDTNTLLIRLASAAPVTADVADKNLLELVHSQRTPELLVLSSRPRPTQLATTSKRITYLCVAR